MKLKNLFPMLMAGAVIVTLTLGTGCKKEKESLLLPREEVITVGKPASLVEHLVSALIGFIFGYKLVGAFIATRSQSVDLQEYIFFNIIFTRRKNVTLKKS